MLIRHALKVALLASTCFVATGCLDQGVVLNKPGGLQANPFPGNPDNLVSLALRVTQFTRLGLGQEAQLEVVALDGNGQRIDPNQLQLLWSAEDGKAITVDQNGVVRGLLPLSVSKVMVVDRRSGKDANGIVTVLGTAFDGDPAALDRLLFVLPEQGIANLGDSTAYHLIALDTQGRAIDPSKLTLNWAVSDTQRFVIDANGRVTAREGSGQADVTATANGKSATGKVFIGRVLTPSEPTEPSTAPSTTPSVTPSVAPSAAPSVAPTVAPSAQPSATPSPVPSPSQVMPFGGDPARLASLALTPSTRNITFKGESALYSVIAKDTEGRYIDPAQLTLTWSMLHPDRFLVDQSGKVTALTDSNYSTVRVSHAASGLSATAAVTMGSSSGGGGGGGGAPAPAAQMNSVASFGNLLFSTSTDGHLYVYNSEGDQLSRYPESNTATPIYASPVVIGPNMLLTQIQPFFGPRVFIVDGNGRMSLLGVEESGELTLLGQRELGTSVRKTPIVTGMSDSYHDYFPPRALVAAENGEIFEVDLEETMDGFSHFSVPSGIAGEMALGGSNDFNGSYSDPKLFVMGKNRTLYSLNQDANSDNPASVRWSYSTDSNSQTGVAIAQLDSSCDNGVAVFGNDAGDLVVVDKNGGDQQHLRTYDLGSAALTSGIALAPGCNPEEESNVCAYVGDANGVVHAVDIEDDYGFELTQSGDEDIMWSQPTNSGAIRSTPMLMAYDDCNEGCRQPVVYVAGGNGQIYRIPTDAPETMTAISTGTSQPLTASPGRSENMFFIIPQDHNERFRTLQFDSPPILAQGKPNNRVFITSLIDPVNQNAEESVQNGHLYWSKFMARPDNRGLISNRHSCF
jgi:hypothetical protein